MHGVQSRAMIGLSAQVTLLAVLTWSVGLSGLGWAVGIGCGIVTNAELTRALAHYGVQTLGPADRVTLARATLAGGVAALTADSFWRPTLVTTLVALTVVALILDGVDGCVARRTGTVSAFGARFDMEVDAFLIMVLSVYVAQSAGPWVLAIGAARYLFVAAGWLLPWLRASVPPRYWGKVVAAMQGVVLTFAATRALPTYLATGALIVSLALLAESFGRQVCWLWRSRPASSDWTRAVPALAQRQPRVRQFGALTAGLRSG